MRPMPHVEDHSLLHSVISGGHLIGLFLDIDATQFLWPTNVTAGTLHSGSYRSPQFANLKIYPSIGTTVALQIVDSIGQAAQTGSFVIQPGCKWDFSHLAVVGTECAAISQQRAARQYRT